jgi:hypothetical protein
MALPSVSFLLCSNLAKTNLKESPAHTLFNPRRCKGVEHIGIPSYPTLMFTIEHEFDATVITLVDEGSDALQEDVIIEAFEDCITITQHDPRRDEPMRMTLSLTQVADLAAALNLPEGSYRIARNG